MVIRIGDANKYITGDHKYVVTYQVRGAVATYEDHDEFYWNIVPFDRDDEIQRASFKVAFPSSWSDSIYAFRAFSGTVGNQGADVVVRKDDSIISGAHRSPLGPKEGITLAVKIPKGLSTYVSDSNSASGSSGEGNSAMKWDWAFSWWNSVPIGLGALLLGLYRRYQRSNHHEYEVPLQTHPPSDMSPAEVGTFFDYKVNRRDIISLLPYWGNKGCISITPIDDGSGDMYFRKIKALNADAPDYQHHLFDGLFSAGEMVRLSDLKEKFYKTMAKTAKLLRAKVHDRELYDPVSQKTLHHWVMIPVGISFLICGGLFIGAGTVAAGIGMILLAIITLVIFFLPPRLSAKGQQYKDHLTGLYDHLKHPVESKVQELLEVDPKYFHYMYPYVLAFDLDKAWAPVKYPEYNYMPPIWFDPGVGHARTFNYSKASESINVRSIEKVFYSTPPPPKSNSGGSIGGGFSGGGFGGGSRGSW